MVITLVDLPTGRVASRNIVAGALSPIAGPADGAFLDLAAVIRELAASLAVESGVRVQAAELGALGADPSTRYSTRLHAFERSVGRMAGRVRGNGHRPEGPLSPAPDVVLGGGAGASEVYREALAMPTEDDDLPPEPPILAELMAAIADPSRTSWRRMMLQDYAVAWVALLGRLLDDCLDDERDVTELVDRAVEEGMLLAKEASGSVAPDERGSDERGSDE
jgi:hypothetical protein